MKLPKSILIEQACSGDPTRDVLNAVYFETLKDQPHPARLIATNGRILAIVPVLPGEHDTTGYITPEVFKAARKTDKSADATLTANGVLKLTNGAEFERKDRGRYPNVDQVWPKEETKFSVTLDPELLLRLAEAIGASRGVTLEFSTADKPVRVIPANNPRAENAKGRSVGYVPGCVDARGVIMPLVLPAK